jgi:outer membrane immunogenic protein
MMKTFVLGIGAALAMAGAASAADLAPRYAKAPITALAYDWSGFHVGVNAGWGTSRNCWQNTTALAPAIANEGCHDSTGGVAGGQLGYRWQAGAWVFGLEGQGNWADLTGRNVSTAFPVSTNETRIRSFGLLTGQIGYAIDRTLLYVKGGGAVAGEQLRSLVTATNGLGANVVNDTRWGATVGAGLDYAFAPNWSVGVAYDHIFLGNRDTTFVSNGVLAPVGATFGERIRQDIDLVTVRVNYRFGGPVVAKD